MAELRYGTRYAYELAEASGATPSLLSHHLRVLREAGMVTAQRRGRWIDYTLVSDRLGELAIALFDVASGGGAPGGSSTATLLSSRKLQVS